MHQGPMAARPVVERQMMEELSSRERECLTWTALGKSSWDIGAILKITENTVNFHIKNAMRKLQTHSRAAAAIKALQLGIVEIPSDGIVPQSTEAEPPFVRRRERVK